MKIIAGQFKGRVLSSFKFSHIRPTTGLVKETIFNKLQGYFSEVRVLDLFSGTGNLGLEAISRGAAFVEMVDRHRKSIEIIKKNIALLNVSDKTSVKCRDIFSYLKSYSKRSFDIIFVDPPFDKKIAHQTMLSIAASSVFSDNTILCIESGSRELLEFAYHPWLESYKKEFSDKRLSFYSVERK